MSRKEILEHLTKTYEAVKDRIDNGIEQNRKGDFKVTLKPVEPEISDVLVPNCIYRGGCPEPNGCGWYDSIVAIEPKLASTNIQERYDAYNNLFHYRGDDHDTN